MNPELPRNPREEMELRITALLLGELSSDEAAIVREAMAKDPELAKLHDDLKATILLVQSATTREAESTNLEAAQPKLSEAHRKKLLTAFAIPALKVGHRKPTLMFRLGLVEMAAVLAIMVALAAMLWPDAYLAKKPSAITALPGRRSDEEFLTLGTVPSKTAEGETAQPGQQVELARVKESKSAINPANVVGFVEVNVPQTVESRFQVSEQVNALSDDAGKDVAIAGRSQTRYSDASKDVRRQLAGTKTSPATPPIEPAKSRTAIVLPSVTETDSDKLAAGALVQQPQETTVAFSVREPQSIAAGDVVAGGRFYRFSGGGMGGGGGAGGAVVQGAAATPAPADRVPVLGDLPMLGKLFRESETLKRDGAVLSDNFATSDFAVVPDSSVANPQLGFDAKTTRGEKIDSLATVDPATGLPAVKLQKESQLGRAVAPSGAVAAEPAMRGAAVAGVEVAQDKSRAEALGVTAGQFGTFVPQAQSLAAAEALSVPPAQQPAPSYGLALSPTPTAPAVVEAEDALIERYGIAAGEVKKGVAVQPADPARRLNESLASNLRGGGTERGRQLIRDGRLLLEAGKPTEAEAKLKSALETDPDNQAARYYLSFANEAKYRNAVRSRESASKDTLVKLERELPSPPPSKVSVTVPQAESRSGPTAAGAIPEQQIAQSSRAYYDKKRELEQLQTFERILGTKLAAERIDLTIPRTSMVEIVDKAQPAKEKTGGLRGLGIPIGGTYASAARITIEPDRTGIEGATDSRSIVAYDPFYTQIQTEIIQSDLVLGRVVESLALDKVWANDGQKLNTAEAVSRLKQKLDLKRVTNTSLIEIRAQDEDPDEAAKIANAVAETYRDYRLQERARLNQEGTKVLEERYQEQFGKIAQTQKELEELRRDLTISDSDAEGHAPIAPVKVQVDTPLPRKSATNAPIPQPEIQTSQNNFSTFSLNVSDVSFKLAAASLAKGQMPDAASVRSEEFINAFDYRDPEPSASAPIAFAWERSRYPFAHNRDLLRFSLKTAAAGRQTGRPLNVVLLLDNSGSMERADRVQIIREALRVLAAQLQPQDKLSVVTFARTPRLVADGIAGDKVGEVTEAVGELTPQGGTNLEEAMNLAYATAAKHYVASGINRVVVLTDGAANLGNVEPESLKQQVEAQRKQGIALDCFGIGWEGFNDDLLEVLSRNGDGRYGFINSPEEAATEFAGQLAGALKVAASDVKVQVEFNPKRVTSYRQIGYAKHQLTKEQFRDNTVDAAEIAAQEAGNALYTIEVNPAGEGPLGTVRVRYKIPGTTDYREQAWDVPYSGAVAALEHSSPAMRLAASASAFAEWLVASPFAGEVTPDRLLGYLGGVPEVYGVDERPKKLEWMIRQAKSIEGK